MAWNFYASNSTSDLSGGADFNFKLLETTSASGTFDVSVLKAATETSYFYTELGIPGAAGIEQGVAYSLKMNVVTGSSSMNCKCWLSQVDASGGLLYGSPESELITLTSGVKTFNWGTGGYLGPWSAGSRLRIAVDFINLAAHATTVVTLGFNTTDSEFTTEWTKPAGLIIPSQFIWL